MKLETFFEKFEQFADAPNAVGKMRELVLALAVRGKLVPQDPNDEPVEDTLFRNDERRRKVALNDHRADEENQLILSGDDRWDVADTWLWRGLADLVLFVDYRGKTPYKLSSGVRLLTAKNVRKGQINLSPEEFLSESEYHAWMTRGFPKTGDVLFTTEAPMGNAAVVELTERFALAQRVICFQSYGALEPFFLTMQILSNQFQLILDKNGTGVTAKGIKASKLKQLPIALPPLAEQKRIVAKVDELMALCDRLEAQQQERETRHAALARASLARFSDAPIPANLPFLFHASFSISPSDLRKSILTLAVQGKLVPQDPDDKPAEELIAKINKERLAAVKARKISPMKPLAPVEDGEVAYDVRPGWSRVRLIELVMEIQTGPFGSSLHQSDYQPGGTPVINPASLNNGKILPIEAMAIGPELLKQLEVFRLSEGDIVMARRGEMGRCAIVTNKENGWLCGTGSLVLRMPTELYAPFLAMLIGAPEARKFLGSASVGTTMQNLNQGILAKMPVGVPPLAEQRRIVAKVDHLMAMVDQLEIQLTTARATAANLLDAIVAELTGTTRDPRSATRSSSSTPGTGRRGRPRKTA